MKLGITLPFGPFIKRQVVELAQHAERLGYSDGRGLALEPLRPA